MKLIILILLLPALAFGQECSFKWDNDVVKPGGLDHNYTNGNTLKCGKWSVTAEMYTPEDKSSEIVDTGSRPWDGLFYLQYEHKINIKHGEAVILQPRIGMLGRASGMQALQTEVHDHWGWGDHPTWAGQNASELALSLVASKRNREYLQSIVGDSMVENEYGVEVGNVKDRVFLCQTLQKHFYKYLYPYTGICGEAIAFNSHLDGRMFHDNTYTVNKNWFVAEAKLGLKLYFPEWGFGIDYAYKYRTEEYDKQVGRHTYGSLEFIFEF